MFRSRTALLCLLSLALPVVACDSKDGAAKKDDAKKGDAKKDGAKKDGAEKADAKKDGGAEAGAVLKLGDAKIFEKDDPKQAMVLSADGSISVEGKKVSTLSADGKLTLTDGKVVLEAKADGTIMIDGKPAPLKLDDTGGSITMGEKTVTFAFKAGGVLEMNPAPDNPGLALAHEGCDAIPKTCSVAMYAMLTGEDASTSPEGSPADAPPDDGEALPPPAPVPAPAK